MQARMKKHPIRKPASFRTHKLKKEASIDWKEAFKEAFGDIPISAVSLKRMRN